jgi:multidrug transporter EmrE-like cation transporter
MNTASLTLILTGMVLNAAAHLLLKAGANAIGPFQFAMDSLIPVRLKFAFEPHIAAGLVCHVVSLAVWVLALSRVEVSIAYPMLSIGYGLNAIAARYLFGEAVGMMRLAGIGVIIIGVYVVARS